MADAYVIDGDLGSGEPGSLQWHKCNLLQRTDDEKITYIREAFPNISDEDKLELTVFLIASEHTYAKLATDLEKLNGDDSP